ncbi:uncharacterized protein N7469_006853 [Penicillium citrinum]|uniref:Uncharacterized protein n=1 Tax=Penicillium citrinum TaxID=5077 RepID=A0A9W9TL28_PENCI|nr:uncharacterized protein N7469_006853 [Penicillium citrinum]KAJ5226847.1 hypothetical protein N7469_006853 [Penicillium citrinum]
MADEQPTPVPSLEGIWMLDDTGKNLRFVSEEELANATEGTTPKTTPPQVITDYLSSLTPSQKIIQEELRSLGWDVVAIYAMLNSMENQRRYNCAMLRQKGYSESEIQRLDALGNQNMTDYSHLRRGLASAAEEDYQLQLYLVEEAKRRRLVMLGEE